MKTPEPRAHVYRDTECRTHSREDHLREFTNLLDGALSAGKPMGFAYLGATGDDIAGSAARFRGLGAGEHHAMVATVVLAATKSGSVTRDELIGVFAQALELMDRDGWPDPKA